MSYYIENIFLCLAVPLILSHFIPKRETTDFYSICDPGNGKLPFVRLCEQFFCGLLWD